MADGFLGKLVVGIGTDNKDLSKGLSSAQKDIQSFTASANKLLGLIGFGLSAAALVNLGKKTVEYGEQLNKMAIQTGMAASEIAKLKYVAEQSDTSLEAVTGTFRFLSRAMNEAKNGNAEAIQTFSRFHVEFQNADGSLRNYKDVMFDVADRIKNTSNQTVVLAESQKLLGRNVQQVLPLFKEGSEGLKRMTSEYEAMQKRIGLTDEQINEFAKNSDALGDSWKDLSTAFQFMLINVMTPLIPKMEQFVDFLVNADWQGVGESIKGVVELFERMAKAIGSVVDWLQKYSPLASGARFAGTLAGGGNLGDAALSGATPTVGGVLPQQQAQPTYDLGSISVSKQGAAPAAGGQGIDTTSTMFSSITEKMNELKAKWSDINKSIGEAWGATMEQISTGFGTSVAEVIVEGKNFSEAMKEMWKDIAKQVIAEIVKMIAQMIILFTWRTLNGIPPGTPSGGIGGGGKFLGIFDKGGVIPQARNGLLYGANGFATTGNMGERGMNAIVHPGEIISPIDKFFDAVRGMAPQSVTIHATGAAANDPQLLAELVAIETDRRRRRP